MKITPGAELDIRSIPPREKHPAIMGRFQALAPGDAFTLVNDHDPVPLYHLFIGLFPGRFTWDYVEDGPEVWMVRIGRPHDDDGRDADGFDLEEGP